MFLNDKRFVNNVGKSNPAGLLFPGIYRNENQELILLLYLKYSSYVDRRTLS